MHEKNDASLTVAGGFAKFVDVNPVGLPDADARCVNATVAAATHIGVREAGATQRVSAAVCY